MILKGIVDEDFVNYKKPSMFLIFPYCSLKCDELNGAPVCQNSSLMEEKNFDISVDEICERYLKNPITNAIVLGGLEPFDSFDDVLYFIGVLRDSYHCNDDVVIYTGYTEEELKEGVNFYSDNSRRTNILMWNELTKFSNIIVKFGRFIVNSTPIHDEVLGINLASPNQYAEVVSKNKPTSKIELNPDKEQVAAVLQALKDNDGYCPCKVSRIEDNKCMCKIFRETKNCECGLYVIKN